ncbi:MAG TPA: iron ABC transporter permease, partial [Actinomycetota bacterium]|nr:iron ABC transporter permease [Actinomycetota bacterium]
MNSSSRAPALDRARTSARPLPAATAALATIVGAAALLPAAYLLIRATEATSQTWEVVLRSSTAWLFARSLGLAVTVTAACIAIGVPLAWLTTRTDLPGRRVWATLFALPLAFPSYVFALALTGSFGDRGMVATLLRPLGIDGLPTISGFFGAFMALTLLCFPYVFLVTAAGIRGLDPSVEEASRTLGRGRWRTFVGVTLPLLRPSITAGSLLVALYCLHDFGAVSLMRFQTFTQAIFVQYRAAFDRTPAAVLSLALILLAVLVLAVEQRARGRARYHRTASARPVGPVALGRWRWPAVVVSTVVVIASLVMPVAVLAFWLGRGRRDGVALDLTWSAAGGAIGVAASGAALTLLAAVPVAIIAARHPGRLSSAIERAAYVGYALPGLVVGLAFVFLAVRVAPAAYQTIPLVLLAYVVLFLPQASQPLKNAIQQVNPRLEEAARTLGRTRLQAFREVVVPQVAAPALAGAALVFLTVMKELPATLLLRPTGFETLATRVWSWTSAGRL